MLVRRETMKHRGSENYDALAVVQDCGGVWPKSRTKMAKLQAT